MRGEKEGFLRVSVAPAKESALQILERFFVKGETASADEVRTAAADAYKRLLQPPLETEMRSTFKEQSDKQAIKVFAENLRQLLMLPPLGEKRVLAIDPGFRTGCKLVCLSAQGDLLHNENIYPHPPRNERKQTMKKLSTLVEQFKIEAIAIGNGTASRETEALVKNIHFDRKVQLFVVNEAGASVYSASKVARDEFPNYDVTVRGAVSIGRRLIDPLAELVKIDPSAIGIGQYQHDVDQKMLKTSLDRVTESCVNQVGVNLNTASQFLLNKVSGLGPQLAENIVEFRKESGAFSSREQLKDIPRLGAKAFEQAAGS
jgi:Transcriptional accessory protein